MSITPLGSDSSQNIANLVMQSLLANGTSSQDTSSLSGILGDLLSVSPAAQQLSQAPTAVTQAMSDLFTGQQDVQGDLAQLKSFFQQNPQNLTSLLNGLQGGTSTYGSTGTLNSNGALLATLMNGQSNTSETGALLNALLGTQNQDPLLASLGDSGDGSANGNLSLFG